MTVSIQNMIFDEYEEYVRKYKEQYGDRTLVLLECGSFYEIYNDGSGLVDMREIGDLLNIQVSRRNKQIVEVNRTNYEMAGFPSHSLRKFVNVLLQHQYTIVIVSQVTPPPNPKRGVTEVISPGTTLDPSGMWDSNELMVIYIEDEKTMSGLSVLSVGCAGIDVCTGKSFVFEVSSDQKDIHYPLDEVYRMMTLHKPKEVYIMSDKVDCYTFDKIKDHLEIERCYCHDYLGRMDAHVKKLSFQNELLKRVFPHTGLLSPIEFVGLERKPYALTAYVKLVEFAVQHNENLLHDIAPPMLVENADAMILSYNCCQQLDIVHPTEKKNCLLSILNQCKTSVGKRYFRNRLLAPLRDHFNINRSYDTVERCLQNKLYVDIRNDLLGIYDIERQFRRIALNVIHPLELAHVYNSLVLLDKASEKYPVSSDVHVNVHATISTILAFINARFDIDRLCMYNRDNIEAHVFQKGVYQDLDEVMNIITHKKIVLDGVLAIMNSSQDYFKLENNEKDGYYFVTTTKRWQETKQRPVVEWNGVKLAWGDFHVKSLTNSVKLTHPYIEKINHELMSLERKQAQLSITYFKDSVDDLHTVCHSHVSSLIERLQQIDYNTTNAFNADKLRLTRPVVTGGSESDKSWVRCTGLRHIIVETANPQLEYVSNDVCIGKGMDGMLLYGINSAGKSSLMKSIGLTIIMAQAGMYVPCTSMEYAPYDKVFTRIFSSDDIFKGQSTFTKEILELRNIMKRATHRSLVIGDELCSGTESISALSIVSAGVYTLAQRKTSFVFATHLHDLVDIPEVKELENVSVYHLSVSYDEMLKKLVYDRKLKRGNGSTMYGIEVCKSLDLDVDFLHLANKVRQRFVEHFLPNAKTSRYNSLVHMNVCGVCKKEKADEVHHIRPQMQADGDGYIGTHHKNVQHNLIPLCEACHNAIHSGALSVVGYVQTTDGIEVKMEESPQYVQKTTPVDDGMTKEIIGLYNECKNYAKKKDKIRYIQSKTGTTEYKIKKTLQPFW